MPISRCYAAPAVYVAAAWAPRNTPASGRRDGPLDPGSTAMYSISDVRARLPRPRGWQVSAVAAGSAALAGGGRGQIHAACGTGKTITAAHIAVQVCAPDGIVVIACPSVPLVAQALQQWAPTALPVLAVCGDDTVADTAVHTSDLISAVTTDPDAIATWLNATSFGARLLVTTHLSASVVGAALRMTGRRADILVVDEAHHSAGGAGKHTALLHDDDLFPAARRLYLTATPRLDDTADDPTALSMDDNEVFGPVLYRYTFAHAIADGWLDDYRIAVVGVTRADLLPLLRSLTAMQKADLGAAGSEDGPLRTAMVATALARAAVEFDLRRVIVYAPRIAASQTFAAALQPILDTLPDQARPGRALTCHHVDGRHSARQRRAYLADLADPPGDGWTVLSNARCLGEGIDVPAVDAVEFTHPKSSTVDIVQAVGRALRRNPAGTGVATILVPVLVGDDPDEAIDADRDGYGTVWQVVRALRAHDEVLAAELDRRRSAMANDPQALPEKIVVRLPDGYDVEHYLRHLTIRLVAATTSPWWEGYGAAAAFHSRHGHLEVLVEHVTDTGYPLGRWLHYQRKARRRGVLPAARIRSLDALGMHWEPRAARWALGLRHATAYRIREGHLRCGTHYVTDGGFRLGSWVRQQRKAYNSGRLSRERTAALEALGIEWNPYQAMWERGISHATSYHARHGHLRVSQTHVEPDGYRLGQFIVAQRMLRKRGTLSTERIAALDALGMVWSRETSRGR